MNAPDNPEPSASKAPGTGRRLSASLLAFLFAGYFAYALSLAAPHLTGGDCGEYVAAGAYLGNVHPPGNPVHHQLSYLFQLAPFGDAYQRSVALSAAAAAGAVAALAYLISALGGSPVVAACTALLFGFSPPMLRNAVVTEVYTLLILYVALYSIAFLRLAPLGGEQARTDRRALLLPFLAGFGMGVHYLTLLFTFPLAWAAWWRGGKSGREFGTGCLLFLAGFLVMLYLPARSLAVPPVNYGFPSTPDAFFRSIFRLLYLSRPGSGRNLSLFLRQGGWLGESLLASTASFIPALAAAGFLASRRRSPERTLVASASLFLAGNLMLQNFPSRLINLSDMPRFVGPALLPVHLLAGLGFERILRGASPGRCRGPSPRFVLLALLLSLVAVAGWRSAALYGRQDDFIVPDRFREGLLDSPPNAAWILDGDTQVFSALSTRFVERLRTDLLPVDRTESFLASVYGPQDAHPDPSDRDGLERYLAEREKAFVDTYEWPVLAFSLPDWSVRTGQWRPYGRHFLLKGGAGEDLFENPLAGPIRVPEAAATACDMKTKAILGETAYRTVGALLDSPGSRQLGVEGFRQLEAIAWEDAGFYGYFGKWLLDRNRPDEAEVFLRRSLAVFPDYLPAKRDLGILLARTGRLDEARRLLSDPRLSNQPEVRPHLSR